jgi:hypothetical protein
VYSPLPDGEAHAVNTAWALLALLSTGSAGASSVVLQRRAPPSAASWRRAS